MSVKMLFLTSHFLLPVTHQVLGGHEGPVSCLCFSPVQSILASASWDRTIRLWDMLDSWQVKETIPLTADGKHGRSGNSTRRSFYVTDDVE